MKYLIQFHNDRTKTAIVNRVEDPLLRDKGWFWSSNHGNHMILYNIPWKEMYLLQPIRTKDTTQ
jgi:hypothetical protein